MQKINNNNNNTILKSFGIEEDDTLQKARHQRHKYLRIENGKYIYDYDSMSPDDHRKAKEFHRKEGDKVHEKLINSPDTVKNAMKGRGQIRDNHYDEARKHEKLAKEKEDKKTTMNNLDWGKTTAERNENLDKYNSLKTDKEKDDFARKLKEKKELTGFTSDEEDEKMSAEEHLERAEYHKREKIKNVGGDHLYVKYLEHSNAEKAHRKMAEERKNK